MSRIHAIDLIKGLGIMTLVVYHRLYYDWYFGLTDQSSVNVNSPLIFIVLIFGSMGGIFSFFAGMTNGMMSYKRYISAKNTPKEILMGGIATGLVMIGIHIIFKIFFLKAENEYSGIIVDYIINGHYIEPTIHSFLLTGTLFMIGIIIIMVSFFQYIIFKKQNFHIKLIYRTLGLIMIIVLIITPFLRSTLNPIVNEALNSKDYFIAFVLSPWTRGYFGIFPMLAFGCYGCIIGIAIERKEPKLMKFLVLMSIITVILGILNFRGFNYIQGPSLLASQTDLGLKLIQLGIYSVWMIVSLKLFDSGNPKREQFYLKNLNIFDEFSKLSLTIYFFEGIVAVIWGKIFGLFEPNWYASMYTTFFFGVFNILFWYLILKIWKRINYKGSIEWILTQSVFKLSGKKSSKLDNSVVIIKKEFEA